MKQGVRWAGTTQVWRTRQMCDYNQLIETLPSPELTKQTDTADDSQNDFPCRQ